MVTLLVVLATVTPAYYEATVATFACNSTREVAELLSIRNKPEAFRNQLIEKVVYGQCVTVALGAVVDGSLEEGNPPMMRVESAASPPGLMAPASDFKLRKSEGAQRKERASEENGQKKPQP